jgi:hypothetical protein
LYSFAPVVRLAIFYQIPTYIRVFPSIFTLWKKYEIPIANIQNCKENFIEWLGQTMRSEQ